MKIKLTDEGRKWMAPVADDLMTFFAAIGSPDDDNVLADQIAEHFSDRLDREVCIPHGRMSLGACVELAIAVIREQSNPTLIPC